MLPGKAVVIEDKCTGCGECVSVCPENAIEMVPISVV
jgi:ferredoxin